MKTMKPSSDSTATRPVSSTTPSDPPFGFSDEERADMREFFGPPVATKATTMSGKKRFVVTFTLEARCDASTSPCTSRPRLVRRCPRSRSFALRNEAWIAYSHGWPYAEGGGPLDCYEQVRARHNALARRMGFTVPVASFESTP